MKRLALLAAMLIAAAPTPALAVKQDSSRFVDIEKQQQFDDQAAAIREEMKPGGRFEFVTSEERGSVERELDRIAALLQKRRGSSLSDDDRLDIYAAQETANAILTQRDGRRLICEFSAPTGSNRKVKQCATYADRMRAHKETRNYLRETLGKSPAHNEQ